MARASDWWVLGLPGDPTPGVVESVQALARQFHDFADDTERAWRQLNSFGGDATALSWIGQSADAFTANFGPLPGRIQKLFVSYREAGEALDAYWPKLQAAQAKADGALRDGRTAYDDVRSTQGKATIAAADLKTAQNGADPAALQTAQTAHDTAQHNLDHAKAQLAAATATANHAYDDRIAAARICAAALHKAQSDGIHNKHWWEHVGEELSKWGGEIAEIAGDIAPILDVIALATSWIPGVDVVTAALAEAANLIALAGTLMQMTGDAMQGHWGDALLSAGMLGATYLGGRALTKYGGKLLEKIGSRGSLDACTGGDPVDVVTGCVLTDETDLALAGVLPVILRRAYSSGYRAGRLFGPGWSSTLDQRISVNAAGIHFAGDDAQVLDYPLPEGDAAVLPARGARLPLVWDREADEIRISDPMSALVWHFAAVHHRQDDGEIRDLTAVSDRNGTRIEIRRDESGTPFLVEHPAYRVAVDTAATAAGTRVTGLRLLDGGEPGPGVTVKEFGYDERGRLTGVVDSTGLPFGYAYDADDRMTGWTDRVGYRYVYEYDERGRVVRGIGDGGFYSASFRYDEDAQTTAVTDSLGAVVTFAYDDEGRVVAVTDPAGGTVTSVYDDRGRLVSGRDQLGRTSRREYDADGNTVRLVRPDGTEILGEYAGPNRPTAVVLPDGGRWRYGYDQRGNLLAVIDPAGTVTEYRYTPGGAVRSVTDGIGRVVTTVSDAAGLPMTVQDSAGAVGRVERDAFGRVTTTVDAVGDVSTVSWSVEGRPLTETGPRGVRGRCAYDAEGRMLEHADAAGNVSRFEYGPFGVVTARTDPSGARYEFAYDTECRLAAVANPAGATWRYAYDRVGNLVSEQDFTGRVQRYRHDAAGQLTGRVNGAGQAAELVRGPMGELLRRVTADGVDAFEYDAAGRLLRASTPGAVLDYARDAAGRIVAEAVDGRSVRAEYDALGRRVRRTTPSGAVSEWSFDAEGRWAALATGAAAAPMVFEYDAAGRETRRTFGDGVALTRGYDDQGRLAEERLWRGGAPAAEAAAPLLEPLLERTYGYRADDVPVRITDSLRGTRDYGLDRSGRVLAVRAATWSETYAYDALGNVTHAAAPGGRGSEEPPLGAADGAGEAGAGEAGGGEAGAAEREFSGVLARRAGRTHYDYDAQGRLVRAVRRTLSGQRKEWTYSWNADDRLVRVALPDGAVWQYTYDALGRRVAKQRADAGATGAERVLFVWDGGQLVEQISERPGGGRESLTWDYDPGAADWTPVAQRRRGWVDEAGQEAVDEAFHAIVADLVGSPSELVAPDGSIDWHLTASLFGAPIGVGSGGGSDGHREDCPLRFPGQYHDDETGLHYNVHRYYDPVTAQYLSPDPLGLAPAPNDHGYSPNPLTTIDPLGLLCQTALNMIQSRVDQLHGLLGGGAGRRSTAIIRATDGEGNIVHVVGWSGDRPLDPRIAKALSGNEIPALQMKGDAEVSALATIKANGWTPLGGAANRPVCPWCQNSLFEPFDAAKGIGPAKLVGPFRDTRITLRPGPGGTIASHPGGGQLTGMTQFTW